MGSEDEFAAVMASPVSATAAALHAAGAVLGLASAVAASSAAGTALPTEAGAAVAAAARVLLSGLALPMIGPSFEAALQRGREASEARKMLGEGGRAGAEGGPKPGAIDKRKVRGADTIRTRLAYGR